MGCVSRSGSIVVALATGCGRIGFDAPPDSSPDGQSPTGTPGCVASETAGPYHADFDLGPPSWGCPYADSQIVVSFAAGVMSVSPVGMPAPGYGGINSPPGDFRNRRVFVEVPAMVNTATDTYAALSFERGATGTPYVAVYQLGGMLYGEVSSAQATMIPYDPVAHRWWQLEERAGTVSFAASPDGIVWTTFAQMPTPAFVSNSYIDVFSGIDQVQTGNLGTAKFDNVVDCLGP